tara:strand:+ start:2436 stop:2852 length:417 start_codon:yes stop_codon:yes gene_type:complete
VIVEALVCLALNGYHEARGELTAGELAVNHVVLNRVADPRYKNDICSVVKAGKYWNDNPIKHACHFSWWCDGLSDEPKNLDAWVNSNQLASSVIFGEQPDITNGSTHYHKIGYYPSWINDRGMVRVGVIGDHIFYRWE